jgi:hypothetical protein
VAYLMRIIEGIFCVFGKIDDMNMLCKPVDDG